MNAARESLTIAARMLSHPDVTAIPFALSSANIAQAINAIAADPMPLAIAHVESLRDAEPAGSQRREWLHRLLGNLRKV